MMGNRGRPRKVVQDEADVEVSFNKKSKSTAHVTKSAALTTRANELTTPIPVIKAASTSGQSRPLRRGGARIQTDDNHFSDEEKRIEKSGTLEIASPRGKKRGPVLANSSGDTKMWTELQPLKSQSSERENSVASYAVPNEKRHEGALLSSHLRKHDDNSSYSCTQCKLEFVSCENLRTHMKLHATKKDFQCHLCDKTYPRSDTLKRHILSFHENKRLYKCDICGKSFKGHIKDHLRTHTEDNKEKPYGCLQCGARFNQRSQMTVHMRVHTGERPYSCKICKSSFSHSTALKLHLRMHTGERPHMCKLCNKRFAQLPHLKKHMLCVHNTDRPYYCEVCETFFKVKASYQDHAAQLHPDRIPADLAGCFPGSPTVTAQTGPDQVKSRPSMPNRGSVKAANNKESPESQTNGTSSSGLVMPIEKLRALLALLLKTISSTSRLKKFGFGTRLIDDVLRDSIIASGRSPCEPSSDKTEREVLTANIEILLEWTIPEDYMENFRAENKPVEAILEELASIG